MSESPYQWLRDPTRICVDKLFFDKVPPARPHPNSSSFETNRRLTIPVARPSSKLKQLDVMEKWWKLTWPNNKTATHHGFKNLSTYLLTPSKLPYRCLAKSSGPDITNQNLQHQW